MPVKAVAEVTVLYRNSDLKSCSSVFPCGQFTPLHMLGGLVCRELWVIAMVPPRLPSVARKCFWDSIAAPAATGGRTFCHSLPHPSPSSLCQAQDSCGEGSGWEWRLEETGMGRHSKEWERQRGKGTLCPRAGQQLLFCLTYPC